MADEIKAIILDVDGVIVGEKIGYNSPNPHPEVIEKLRQIQNTGIPIILCTAKPHFALKKLIVDSNLDNFHITDGGGVIIDPLQNRILTKHCIPSEIAPKVVEKLLSTNVYTEIYTVDNYIIESSQKGEITDKHELVIQSKPKEVESLLSYIKNIEITKIMPIAKNIDDKMIVDKTLQQFVPEVTVSWGVHPVILPLQFGIVTAPGISKSIAASEILKNIGVSPEKTLGVGDSTSDWQFIESCGYAAAMGNASEELKQLILKKGIDHSYIAPTVDNNGIIDVFKYFKIG